MCGSDYGIHRLTTLYAFVALVAKSGNYVLRKASYTVDPRLRTTEYTRQSFPQYK